MPTLMQARKDLERFQALRSRCLALHAGIGDRKLRAAVATLLTQDLGSFRLFLDHVACSAADACGECVFSNAKGVDSAVDLFFGAVMGLEVDAHANSTDALACVTRLQRAARQFMKTARLLPYDCKAELRLRRCERQFEELCNKALAALHAT